MEKILLISASANDTKTISFAKKFASRHRKTLVIARTYTIKPASVTHKMQIAGSVDETMVNPDIIVPAMIDISRFTEQEVADYARKENFTMLIARLSNTRLNLQVLLNNLHCPLMLLPANEVASTIERMVYLTDLRYCQQQVLSHLSGFDGASLLLAHICQEGMPDLSEGYGQQLFTEATDRYHHKFGLFFSHIMETHMPSVADTLVGTMQADMLVCMNRHFHFRQLLGEQLPVQMPTYLPVPLLIFPC